MTNMETMDATRDSTHPERTAPSSRHPWFRKSKSETDKESWQRVRPTSSGAVIASTHAVPASWSSSTSSTAASGAHNHRADTMSSSSSQRTTSSVSRLAKDVAVQCTLVAGECAVTSYTGCNVSTTLPNEKVSIGGMCVDMEAMHRGTSHQRRKAISAGDDETLLTQHTVNYR